jgi:glycosyltransferase involved in cell wall biosynthesis
VIGSDVNLGLGRGTRRKVILAELDAAALVLAKSEALKGVLVGAGVSADRVRVQYNGVDRSVFQYRPRQAACAELGARAERARILFVGGLVAVKNVGALLHACARLPDQVRSRLDLVLVGEGHLRRELVQLARTLNLEAQATFVGAQAPSIVASWMNASDLLCLPSLNEGVPNVVLEALSSGCPAVATDVGGVSEVHPGESAGALVAPGDVEALTQALTRVLEKPWDRASLAGSFAGCSWEANARAIDQMLRELLSARR